MAIGPHWPDPAKKIIQFPHGRGPTLPSAKPSVQPITQLIERANRPKTIRFEIVSLVAICLIPLVAVIALLAVNLANTKRQLIEVELVDIAGQVTTMADRDVASVIGMLRGLATSGDLVTGELADFKKHAAALAARPYIIQVWAFDPKGITVAAQRSIEATSIADDPDLIRRVFSGQSVVSPVSGEGLKKTTVVIAVPVAVDGRVVFGVAAEIHVDHFSNLFEAAGLKEDWAAAIVDENGRYVARSLDAERRVGKLARPELGEAGATAPASTYRLTWLRYEDPAARLSRSPGSSTTSANGRPSNGNFNS